jgi:hypothetical protein
VKAEGNHKVHVIQVSADHITLDPRFDLDFNRDISTGPAPSHTLRVEFARLDLNAADSG